MRSCFIAVLVFPLATGSAFQSVRSRAQYVEEESPSEIASNLALLKEVVDTAKEALHRAPFFAGKILDAYKLVFVSGSTAAPESLISLIELCQGSLPITSLCQFLASLASAEVLHISDSKPVYRLAVHEFLAELVVAAEAATTHDAFKDLTSELVLFQTDPVISSAIVSQFEYLVGLSDEYEPLSEANKPEQVDARTWTRFVKKMAAMHDETNKRFLTGHRVSDVRRLRDRADAGLRQHEQERMEQERKKGTEEIDTPEVTLVEISKLAVAAMKQFPSGRFTNQLIACYQDRDVDGLRKMRDEEYIMSLKEKLTKMLKLFNDVRPEEWQVSERLMEDLRHKADEAVAAGMFRSLITTATVIVKNKHCSDEIIMAIVDELEYMQSFTTPTAESALNILEAATPAEKCQLVALFVREAKSLHLRRNHLIGAASVAIKELTKFVNARINKYQEVDSP